MLVIHKKPVFDGNFLPEPGQCQLHTPGWILRDHGDGKETVLYSGSYYACRRIQLACTGHLPEEHPEIIARMIREITDLNLAETATDIPRPPSVDETSDLDPVDPPTADDNDPYP